MIAEQLERRELLSVNQILFDAASKQVSVIGTGDSDQVIISYDSATVLRVRAQSVDGLVERTFQTSSVSLISFQGGASGDVFRNVTSVNSIVRGEDGDDDLGGGDGIDLFYGGAGNDTLNGKGGNDQIYGDAGADWLLGDLGDDQLYGGDDHDTLDGGVGNDTIVGGFGSDLMLGLAGNDRLWGEAGDDRLYGHAGDDQLYGGAGNDTLDAGDDQDSLYGEGDNDWLLGGAGNDFHWGGDGNDTLDGGIGNDYLNGGQGFDLLYGGDGDDQLLGMEHDDKVYGGNGNDEVYGGSGKDSLYGEVGDDVLNGDSENDELYGGLGNDRLAGGDNNDSLFGDAGDDLLDGQIGDDNLHGGLGNDALYGGSGFDYLAGDEGNDSLNGGDGDDQLWGFAGNDWLRGGAGKDDQRGGLGDDILNGDDGNDVLYGEEGRDWLMGDLGDDQLYGGEDHDTLDGGMDNDALLGGVGSDLLLGGSGNDRLWGESGDDRLYGSAGDDQLYGDVGNDTLDGGDDQDSIYGEADNDWLLGGNGIDLLYGNEGHDTLDGGAGNDTLNAGAGFDLLLGGDGNDYLLGMEQGDRLYGGSGNDEMYGGSGRDSLYGDLGDDILYGDAEGDELYGGLGNDRLEGGDGNDWIRGEDDNDFLIGNGGSDQLYGDSGDDELIGSQESDLMFGGNGNDLLQVSSGQHLLSGDAGNDRLIGLTGNDVLIGGAGKDELLGYGGDDLLIGGTTDYDSNVAQLAGLFAVWTAASPYSTRVDLMSNESFAYYLRSNQTVHDDQVADVIFGNEGQDWFFLTGVIETYDPNSSQTSPTDESGHSHSGAIVDQPPALEGFQFVDSLDKISDRQKSESLHTLIAHADDPSLQREHLTLMQLVRYDQVTHYAVTTGAWSNPSTWAGGVVPTNNARVLIPIGVRVTVDRVITARVATIRVDGTLAFSTTANSELRVDTIVVANVGRFEMGTAALPIPANITAKLYFTDNGPIDRQADPFGIGRGLISHGSVSIYGAPVLTSSAIISPVLAGTNVLVLESVPIGWKVNHPVVIAGTVAGTTQNELRNVLSISGNTVVLDRPLTYNHVPDVAGAKIHVANGMRNIWILSEAEAADRRGHVMFMHNRDVHIDNAGFYQLGRTDKSKPINDSVVDANWQLKAGTGTNSRARYSVHFHRNGFVEDGNPATITNSVVSDSPGWGFVNHSSYVDMVNNFAYDTFGAGFVTEVGNEIGSFVNNIAIGAVGSGEETESRLTLQDFGHEGDGFWLQGTGVRVTGNVAAGNNGSAFIVFAQGLIEGGNRKKFAAANLPDPSIAGGAAEIDVSHVPMLDFSNNVGYASGFGLSIWYHLRETSHGQTGVFRDSTFWGNIHGVDIPYTQDTILRNLTIVRKLVPDLWNTANIGIRPNMVTRNITYDNLTVTGHYRGVVVPRSGKSTVIGGRYQNHDDFQIQTGINADRVVEFTGNLQVGRILMDPYFINPEGNTSYLFLQDRVYLNFGSYRNQRVYYGVQAPNAIPFPAAIPGLPTQYLGLTSQQLWNQHRIAVGGTLAPVNTVVDPLVMGLVGPAT